MAAFKIIREMRRYFPQGSLGRGRIKDADIDQLDFTGTKDFGTTQDLRDIKTRFQPIEHHNKIVDAWSGQNVTFHFLVVADFDLSEAWSLCHLVFSFFCLASVA